MKKCLLFLGFLLFLFNSYSQDTFISIEQANYVRGDDLHCVGGSHYLIEITFNLKARYILLKNKDTGQENRFINVVPGEISNSWRGYSKTTKQALLFTILTNNGRVCISVDDKTSVTLFLVNGVKSNPTKNQHKQ
ncbi:hypothetical protein A4H97_24245 [Niastella yeongjuensis]|uniref:Uncharacterized protein n=1 Tax=Niastella yeongjuensis TaxID=354355 RepID=A0A1V9F366_9BACT|nr:hypothetical protein A4H97_24245 [Niastella yeongjuensis]SEP20356.1 hypothetical protein SAMN05660816_04737 [Niastella yeongjuensis]